MRRLCGYLCLALVACDDSQPPPLGDHDGALVFDVVYPPPIEASTSDASDGGSETLDLDFEGICTAGLVPVWHFFDFQTHTPGDSALDISAQSAPTESALGAAPAVPLATVTGPDITTWTGVDVDPKLQSIGQSSKLFLRVSVHFTPGSDADVPSLVHYRQAYDCVPGS